MSIFRHFFFFLISDILLECRYGYYGERCSNECGHCLNNTACHHVTGTCENGCEPGYKAPNCTDGIIYIFYYKFEKEKHIAVHKLFACFFISHLRRIFVSGQVK